MDQNQNIPSKPTLLEKITQVWSSSDNQENIEVLKRPSDATFVKENVFAVADSEAHSIVMYYPENEYDPKEMKQHTLNTGEIWPNCISFVDNGTLAVTDRKTHTVKFFDANTGTCVHTWTKRHMEKPHGIAVTNRGLIVVTDIGASTLNVLSPDGHLLVRKCSRGSDVQQLNLPFYCAVDKKDNIIVSDNMNYCLKIFDHNGIFKQRIGSGVDWGRRQFLCPYGVTVDPNGNILAADNENHKVFMFDNKGKFLKHMLVRADCYNPCGITMGPCGNLVVTESACDHFDVKMFKMYNMPEKPTSPVWQKRVISW